MSQRKINEMFVSSGKSPSSSQSRTDRAKSKSRDAVASNDDSGDSRPVAKNPTPRRGRRASQASAKSPRRDQDSPSMTLIPSTPPFAPLSSQNKTPNSTGRANERVLETPQEAQSRGASRAASQETPARRTPSKGTPNKATPKKPTAQKPTPEKPAPKKPTPKKSTPKKSTPKKLPPKKSTTPLVGSSPFTAIDVSSGAESSDCELELVKVEPTPPKRCKQNTAPGSENTNTKRKNTREVAPESPTRPAAKPKPAIEEKQVVQKQAHKEPAAKKPAAQKLVVKKPSQKSAAQKPAQRSATEEPTARKPSAQKIAAQKPTAEKQDTRQLTVQKSTAKKPRAKSLTPRAKPPCVPSSSAPATLSVPASQSARPAIKAKFLKGSQLELARSSPAENKADDSDCFIEKVEPSPKRRAQSQPATTPAKKKRVSKAKAAVAVSDNGPVEKKSVKKKPVETDSDCEIVKVTRSPKKCAKAAKPAPASAPTMTRDESDADADAENSEEDCPPRKKARPALRKKLPPRSPKTLSSRTPAKTKPAKVLLQDIATASPVIDLTEGCDSEDSEISSDDVSGSNSDNSPAVLA
ncbi:hypothetical protein QQZ08_001412 [Neonectria magnoliae]|uniref:Proteoglycan 4-like n=1 Tax=Neonectria magnoliae TaxID=2732573 RepID=A0ABR1IH40_9HYPO